ncbi:macro domain containing protein [Nitzschia inconspicua]|uniref:Macro domain containing protein n=1 Tax=Nitzschia inconspicua TaxID=303405 RepID=A0A9K3QAH9_9STRA|nr:macro domain containing protein [Nitzschia inconspicua]
MSTAWYRSGHVPKMIQKWSFLNSPSLHIEVWDTTCVVHNMTKQHNNSVAGGGDSGGGSAGVASNSYHILLNPANPQLSGVSKFPYFPIGGPQPPPGFEIQKDTHPIMGYVSQWGGMEVGNGMMFASNVVDGLVHQLGGKELQRALQQVLEELGVTQLQEGQAVATTAQVGTFHKTTGYQYIIHAVPPFYQHQNNTTIIDDDSMVTTTTSEILAETYRNALQVATRLAPKIQQKMYSNQNHQHHDDDDNDDDDDDAFRIRIATPLLGAGCRGFPTTVAIRVAADTLTTYSAPSGNMPKMTVAFAIPDGDIRQQLVNALNGMCDNETLINKQFFKVK